MNTKQIFTLGLGLEHPWKLRDVSFEIKDDNKVLVIDVGFERGHKFIDPDSGQACPVHDTIGRSWRHLNFFQHECQLRCKVPRIRTPEGNVRQVSAAWSRPGSGFTLLFEAYSMLLVESEMPVNKVGKVVGEYPKRIWTIFNYWLGVAYGEADHSGITQLGIDETSARKGHDYITVAVDMDRRNVVHATPGKGADTIRAIKDHLESKGTPPGQIQQVCIDLSPAFISGVTRQLPAAQIVFDRFHVKQLLNKAMDQVRREQRSQHTQLKGHKYTFLKSNKDLSAHQQRSRQSLIEWYPLLGDAYRLKELFVEFWSMNNRPEAEGFLAFWCDLAEDAGIPAFTKFAATVKAHWEGIVNYIETRINNGVLEGINSKIQLAKRRARGYRNTTNFINMITLPVVSSNLITHSI
jgi:transposase